MDSTLLLKKTLKERGITVTKLAKDAGYTRAHISNVVHGHFESPRARHAIAKALEVDPRMIWPEYGRRGAEA